MTATVSGFSWLRVPLHTWYDGLNPEAQKAHFQALAIVLV
jgi:hypothetical protein